MLFFLDFVGVFFERDSVKPKLRQIIDANAMELEGFSTIPIIFCDTNSFHSVGIALALKGIWYG